MEVCDHRLHTDIVDYGDMGAIYEHVSRGVHVASKEGEDGVGVLDAPIDD